MLAAVALAAFALGAHVVGAQSPAADTAAIRAELARVIPVQAPRCPGMPRLHLTVGATAAAAGWIGDLPRLVAEAAPEAVAVASDTACAVRVTLDTLAVAGDSAQVRVAWAACHAWRPRRPWWHFYDRRRVYSLLAHTETLLLHREGTAWRFGGARGGGSADGSCEPPARSGRK